MAATNKFGSSSLRGSPSRTGGKGVSGDATDKAKNKPAAPVKGGKDAAVEEELEKTEESVEYAAFRN